MRRYAEDTKVPIARSREEIVQLLRSWRVDGITWADDFERSRVVLRFVWHRRGGDERYLARFAIQLPDRKALEPRAIDQRNGTVSEKKLARLMAERGMHEHRVLLLWLRAAFNAVEAGIVSAETLFLPFLEDQEGRTVAEVAIPRLSSLLDGAADRLLLPERA